VANGAGDFLGAAMFLDESFSFRLSVNNMELIAPGRALAPWRLPEWVGTGGTNEWPAFLRGVTNNQHYLAGVRAATAQPELRFSINYYLGPNVRLNHLQPVRKAAQCLRFDATAALHDNRVGDAQADLQAMWRITQAMEGERLLVSQMVRSTVIHQLHGAFWDWLEHPQVTDAQLAAWSQRWQQMELLRGAEIAFNYELASNQAGYELYRQSPNNSSFFRSSSWGDPLDAVRSWLNGVIIWPYLASYREEQVHLEGALTAMLALRGLRQGQTWIAGKQTLDPFFERVNGKASNNQLTPLDPAGLQMFGGILSQVIRTETLRRLTVTAIALKRHHLKHGHYPAELAALVPEFLAEIQLDPIDAKALRYRSNPDGTFTLYAIGFNGRDDRGSASPLVLNRQSLNWLQGRDWVWPQPATLEQIQAWQEKQRPAPKR
jgi:hypothetical protein